MDRRNLRQIFSGLFWLMFIFAFIGGKTWAVWVMTAAAIGWLAVWLTMPGAALGVLIGLIALLTGN